MKRIMLKIIDGLLLGIIITVFLLMVFGLQRNGIMISFGLSAIILLSITYILRNRDGLVVLSVFTRGSNFESLNIVVRGGPTSMLEVNNLSPKNLDITSRKQRRKSDSWKYNSIIASVLVGCAVVAFIILPAPTSSTSYSKHLVNNPNWECDLLETICQYEFEMDNKDATIYFEPRTEVVKFWISNVDENQVTYRHHYDINNKEMNIYAESQTYVCDVDGFVVACDQALQSDNHKWYLVLFLKEIETAKQK